MCELGFSGMEGGGGGEGKGGWGSGLGFLVMKRGMRVGGWIEGVGYVDVFDDNACL